MPIFAPGVAAGVLQGQDAMRQQAEQQQLMAQRKQQMQYQAWQEEQARQQAATQLRAQQGVGTTMSGMFPPPVQGGQPNGAAPAPAPSTNFAPSPPSQAPTASPGSPPPPGNPVPPYRTVANTQPAPQGQLRGQGGGQMQVPSVAPSEPAKQPGILERFVASMRAQGKPDSEWGASLDAAAPGLKMAMSDEMQQAKEQGIKFNEGLKTVYAELEAWKAQVLAGHYNTQEKQADRRLEISQGGLDVRERKAGMGGSSGGGMGAGGGGGSIGGSANPGAAAGKSDAEQKQIDYYSMMELMGDHSWKTGLSRGKDGAKMILAIEKYVPKLAETLEVTPGDVLANRGGLLANFKALTDATKREAGIELATNALDGHIANLNKLLDATAAKGGATIVNKPINAIRRAMSSPEIAQLDLAAKQVANEYERAMVGGSLSVAQLHQGAAEDANKLLNGDMTPEQIRAIIPIMRQEMAASKAGAQKTRKELQDRIRQPVGSGGAAPAGAQPSGQDAEAIAWAKANPNDPRAAQIMKLRGM